MAKHPRRARWVVPVLAAVLAVASCRGGDGDESATTASAAATSNPSVGGTAAGGGAGTGGGPAGASGLLAGVCPGTIVVQTDWNPEATHGGVYELLGDAPAVDPVDKRVTGPLVAGGEDTGVQLEVRIGGPAIGFRSVASEMYRDPAITVGLVPTDEAIRSYVDMPTKAVVSLLDINPLMIMWDPETYPDVNGIAAVGVAGAPVRYFDGAAYMEYLVGAGLLDRSQLDPSYDGTQAVFVSQEGAVAQQGAATVEPYTYENEVRNWGKPVEFQLVHDAGWQPYSQSLAIRLGDAEGLRDCLAALVPMVQQAQLDYVTSPRETNELILELVRQYNTGWVYSPGVADFSVQQQLRLGLVGNGPDSTLGNFDEARVTDLISKALPVYGALGEPPPESLTAADIVTNEFIDPNIGA